MQEKQILENLSSNEAVLILGYGVTGKALADFCDKKKWSYHIVEDFAKVTRESNNFLAVWSQNHLPQSLENLKVRMIFHSPGVSLNHPIAVMAQKERIPILSELELASFYIQGKLIGVTGTNGKSTTVKLLYELLKNAGVEVSLKGNIGEPLITAVGEPPKLYHVVEESSFQLEIIKNLSHSYSICLNVSDDHFDRHQNLATYVEAKSKLIANATAEDFFIYNLDNPYCAKMVTRSKAKNIPFSLTEPPKEGGGVSANNLVIRLCHKEYKFSLSQCALKGLHNAENSLAALIVTLLIDESETALASYRKTLQNFKSLPHRLEKIFSENGVDYYDDSKGTNVDAVVMALASFEKNIILIAGGVDKHGDYSPLKGLVHHKVKKLILLGEAKTQMFSILKDQTHTVLVEDMKEAVAAAKKSAEPGDVVLLSPACASFDQYKNYAERGFDFQRWVKEGHV